MKSTPEKHFYTLIEIMTVIVIAAILFGIGIPAFTTMIRGNNMTVAIRQLSSKISAARAYAVANRCNVAVILVENESGVKDDYCYSAYRVCVVEDEKDSSDKYPFREWIEDENWKTLPKGVLRESVSKHDDVNNIPVSNGSELIGGSFTTASALIFQKNGQMKNDTSTIKLRQGRYVNSSFFWTERSGDGKIISHPIEVQKYSGKVTVKDITEDSASGT